MLMDNLNPTPEQSMLIEELAAEVGISTEQAATTIAALRHCLGSENPKTDAWQELLLNWRTTDETNDDLTDDELLARQLSANGCLYSADDIQRFRQATGDIPVPELQEKLKTEAWQELLQYQHSEQIEKLTNDEILAAELKAIHCPYTVEELKGFMNNPGKGISTAELLAKLEDK